MEGNLLFSSVQSSDLPFRSYIEGLVNPSKTSRIYKNELKQLADYVSNNSEAGDIVS